MEGGGGSEWEAEADEIGSGIEEKREGDCKPAEGASATPEGADAGGGAADIHLSLSSLVKLGENRKMLVLAGKGGFLHSP